MKILDTPMADLKVVQSLPHRDTRGGGRTGNHNVARGVRRLRLGAEFVFTLIGSERLLCEIEGLSGSRERQLTHFELMNGISHF